MKIAIENLNRVKTIKQFTHKKLAEKTGCSPIIKIVKRDWISLCLFVKH